MRRILLNLVCVTSALVSGCGAAAATPGPDSADHAAETIRGLHAEIADLREQIDDAQRERTELEKRVVDLEQKPERYLMWQWSTPDMRRALQSTGVQTADDFYEVIKDENGKFVPAPEG